MPYVNLPPNLNSIFTGLDNRLTKVENSQRFTMPSSSPIATQPTITGLVSGDPSNPRVGDVWLNSVSNVPKYVDSTGAVSTFGGGNSFLLYTNNTQRYYDYSLSNGLQSLLDTISTGFIVSANQTFQYEFFTSITSSVVANAQTASLNIASDQVSGSNTSTIIGHWDYGNNATSLATATTMSSIKTSSLTGVPVGTSGTSGQRYFEVYAKGILRISGSGTARVYPWLGVNATNPDNSWSTLPGTTFKLTPLGTSTATTIGTLG
jgi:hypothetical protein